MYAPRPRTRAELGTGLRLLCAIANNEANLSDETGFLERYICASLFHRLQTTGRDIDGDFFAELGNEKRLFLHVYVPTARSGRVEFGRTGTVGIPTTYLALLSCYIASSCHSEEMVRYFV